MGIEKAGFDTLGLIECDKDASDPYRDQAFPFLRHAIIPCIQHPFLYRIASAFKNIRYRPISTPFVMREHFELVPPGGYWRDIPEDIAKEYKKYPLSSDKYALCHA